MTAGVDAGRFLRAMPHNRQNWFLGNSLNLSGARLADEHLVALFLSVG